MATHTARPAPSTAYTAGGRARVPQRPLLARALRLSGRQARGKSPASFTAFAMCSAPRYLVSTSGAFSEPATLLPKTFLLAAASCSQILISTRRAPPSPQRLADGMAAPEPACTRMPKRLMPTSSPKLRRPIALTTPSTLAWC